MESTAQQCFQQLYTADGGVNPIEMLQVFEPMISDDVNATLCKGFSGEEISDTLFQIGPLKALGSDGFPTRFFQRNWDTTKPDIIREVKRFFETGHMPPAMNETTIVLIPMTNEPELLRDF
jgi:hypothetical protein